MKRLGLRPQDVTAVEDLPKLPILTKDDVRENFDRLIADSARRRGLITRHTSGSTGSSLATLATPDAVAFQWAIWWRHRARFGIQPGCLHANFSGRPVVPIDQTNPPYWRWNRAFNQVIIPMQQVVPLKIPAIHSLLHERDFAHVVGYPSIVHSYVEMAEDAKLEPGGKARYVFTGAENLYPFQRDAIVRFTGALVSQQYGMSEGAANASECEELVLHEDFEFGVMEAGAPTRDRGAAGISGSIIATGFSNYAFPLIRYDTGDVATWLPKDYKCACNRPTRAIASIDGRAEDYVLTPEGQRVARFGYVFKDAANIRKAQIIQRVAGSIIVRVVPTEAFDDSDEVALRSSIATWISPRLGVDIEAVASIPQEPDRKFRAVVRAPGI